MPSPFTKVLSPPRSAALFGLVTDGQTGEPLAGADVQLSSTSNAFKRLVNANKLQLGAAFNTTLERPDRTQSRANGSYRFVDLPNAAYTISVTLPAAGDRFGAGSASATVSNTTQPAIANVALPPTAVTGLIQSSAGPVQLAIVRVQNSDDTRDSTVTDLNGNYLLDGVEPGQRTLVVYARGLSVQTISATLTRGVTTTVNKTLGP